MVTSFLGASLASQVTWLASDANACFSIRSSIIPPAIPCLLREALACGSSHRRYTGHQRIERCATGRSTEQIPSSDTGANRVLVRGPHRGGHFIALSSGLAGSTLGAATRCHKGAMQKWSVVQMKVIMKVRMLQLAAILAQICRVSSPIRWRVLVLLVGGSRRSPYPR